MVCRVGFCFDGPPPSFWPGGVREPGAVPAVPGRRIEPPLFTGGLSFPETRRCSCCAGPELCAPDVGVAGAGRLFLLCRGSAVGGRWVLRACFPALYRTGSPAHCHRTIWWLEVSLFLLCRDVGHGRRLSSETYPSRRPDGVPAVPDWPPAPQTKARLETAGYSCCAGAQKRRGAGYCECPFLLYQAEDLTH